MNLEELMASTPPMQQHALIKGFQAGAASRDAEVAELVAALSRLTRCAPATVECENMHHRKLDQHSYDKTCHLVSRYAEALCNAQELLAKVRKP